MLKLVRSGLLAMLVLLPSATVLAQSSGTSSGTGGSSSASPSATQSVSPPSAPPASTGTQSQQNLDVKPPTTSMPPQTQQGARLMPAQPQEAAPLQPGSQDSPPPLGSGRPQPGGANSSAQSGRTGKNPLDESYSGCLGMWERETHMSREEWARACRRVADRSKTLKAP